MIAFRPLAAADFPLLHEWLSRPHVAERWGGSRSLEEVREEYTPFLTSDREGAYIAYEGEQPVGYAQHYRVLGNDGGWWPDAADPDALGMDQYLADAARLGQGLGSRLVREFVGFLFRERGASRVQADPSPDNPRAIRCYEKAGFTRVGEVETPDGRALLLEIAREEWLKKQA